MDAQAHFYTVFEVVLSGVDFPAGISLAVLCVPEFALVFAKECFAKLKVLNGWAFSIWRKSKTTIRDKRARELHASRDTRSPCLACPPRLTPRVYFALSHRSPRLFAV